MFDDWRVFRLVSGLLSLENDERNNLRTIPKKPPKIKPRGPPDGSRGLPGELRITPGSTSGALSKRKEPRRKKRMAPGTSREDFWVPLGRPKSTKNVTFSKNDAPVAVFLSIFAGKAAGTNFFLIFCRFLSKNSLFFSSFFFRRPYIFLDMSTLTKHCKLYIETHFFIFLFFVFLLKNVKNPRQNMHSKNKQKCPLGDPFGIPK